MFRSLTSSVFTFLAVLLFAFALLFVWNGNTNLEFTRVAMEGDQSTAALIQEHYNEQMQAQRDARHEAMPEKDEPAKPATSSGDGPPVVLWISIPGFRGDYLEKAETSAFDQLVADGGGTNKMRPAFPCLTFPAHTTLATGAPVSKHGIVADRLRLGPGEVVDRPVDSSLILAEPIWITATRQGLPVLVHDWPLSQEQSGEHAAAHFKSAYDREESDAARLDQALAAWRAAAGTGTDKGENDSGDEEAGGEPATDESGMQPTEEGAMQAENKAAKSPGANASESGPPAAGSGSGKLRLVMLRLDDIEKAALVNGPRTQETYDVIAATDKALGEFLAKVREEWNDLAPANANLHVLITTDHGMAELDKNVNLPQLLGEELMANADIVAHDAIANLYFKDLPESEGERDLFIEKFDGELKKFTYFRTFTREDLPENYDYLAGDRVGDRIIVLKPGYGFTDMQSGDEPVFDPAQGPGYFGGYGYPVAESLRMSGQVILAGYPNSAVSDSLGETSQLVFHATVCKLLGIEPSPDATAETLPVDP